MPGLDDVAAVAFALAEVTEGARNGQRTWLVAGRTFAWERRFSKADLKRFGDEPPPQGPILAVRVEDLQEREAILATKTPGFFTIAHFDGYPAYLVALDTVSDDALRTALLDAWLACAPPRLTEPYLRP